MVKVACENIWWSMMH